MRDYCSKVRLRVLIVIELLFGFSVMRGVFELMNIYDCCAEWAEEFFAGAIHAFEAINLQRIARAVSFL